MYSGGPGRAIFSVECVRPSGTENILCPADFNEPFQPPGQAAPPGGGGAGAASDDDIAMIVALGFSREQALRALKATVGNVTPGKSPPK